MENQPATIPSDDKPHPVKKIHKKKKQLEYKEITFKDGSVFRGQTQGKRLNGTGQLIFQDNSIFKGSFIKGKPGGFGEKYWP